MVAPIGMGQRGLIVSPPKAGKTMMLQNIAQSIAANYPDVYLIVLLIDERPEEVTEMQRSVKGEVVSSTFDEPATRHVQVAEMVIEKAKRLVEHKRDVVILLDSITRLGARLQHRGAGLRQGADRRRGRQRPAAPQALLRRRAQHRGGRLAHYPRHRAGGDRLAHGRRDLRGVQGHRQLRDPLDRRIAEKRVFPAININRSGTRREELLVPPDELQKIWILRKLLHPMDELAASEFLLDKLKDTKTNAEFFDSMKRQ